MRRFPIALAVLLASKAVGLQEMPCIVQEDSEKTLRFAQQLVENIHREDLSPVDKARALIEFKENLGNGRTWAEVEQRIGISETRRKQFVALLSLPEEIQKEIVAIGKRPSKSRLTEKHARALLLLKKMPDKQAELFESIQRGLDSISGDMAINKAKRMKGAKPTQVFRITYQNQYDLIQKLEKVLLELRTLGDSKAV